VGETSGRPTVGARPGVPLAALSRTSVHDGVRERLKAYISGSGLQPGDRLPGEEVLAAQLRVGRPAVREALRALEAVGAIVTRKGVGRFVGSFVPESYVRNFTTESLIASFSERELMETRCLLEIAAIPQAVARLTEDDLTEIERLLEEMRQHVASGEPYTAEDLGMHRVIMRHVDNRLIAAMLDAVYALTTARVERTDWAEAPERPERSRVDLAEHIALAEAVLARDGALAQRRLMAHFATTARRLGFAPAWQSLFGEEVPAEDGSTSA
jgi:GntR family transcriptional repressor for pyruvate dehydrogenase complex